MVCISDSSHKKIQYLSKTRKVHCGCVQASFTRAQARDYQLQARSGLVAADEERIPHRENNLMRRICSQHTNEQFTQPPRIKDRVIQSCRVQGRRDDTIEGTKAI